MRINWRLWLGTLALFAIPFIAMQLTDEVEWDVEDFAIFGAMLILTCGLYEITTDITKRTAYRAVVGASLAIAFVLV